MNMIFLGIEKPSLFDIKFLRSILWPAPRVGKPTIEKQASNTTIVVHLQRLGLTSGKIKKSYTLNQAGTAQSAGVCAFYLTCPAVLLGRARILRINAPARSFLDQSRSTRDLSRAYFRDKG